jgi:phosphoribosyl 1,2-cyclic phosphodiesterase
LGTLLVRAIGPGALSLYRLDDRHGGEDNRPNTSSTIENEPMSIKYEILGEPGRDNAMLATVNTGQSQHRLLFDCGEGCLHRVSRAEIQVIEVLFFSHFHIDHVAGFDSFFR